MVSPLITLSPRQEDRPSTEGTEGASYSTSLTPGWKCTFSLGKEPLLATSILQTWRKGEGGCIADNLGQALMLPKDVHFWVNVKDKDMVLNLKWHTITVSVLSRYFFRVIM